MTKTPISIDERSHGEPKYFFTGFPCHRGHVTVRYVKGHACAQCLSTRVLARQKAGKALEYQRAYCQRDYVKAKAHARNKVYREANPSRQRDNLLKHKFGLPIGEYGRMLAAQGGLCAICGGHPKRRRLAVDHDHKTGKVRGLLCEGCNTALGGVKDNPDTLWKALAYLEKHKEGPDASTN